MHKCRILPTMKIWRTKYLRTTDITGALIMKAKLLNRSLVLCILLCFVLAIGAGGCKKKPVQYTLTVAIAGQGQVTPDVGTHKNDAGTVVTLTATPAENYAFDGWSGPDSGTIGTAADCYATGSITVSPEASQPQNTNTAGGFCGELKKATVSRCYATGNVTSAGFAGGFAAIVSGSTLTDCYARGTVSKIDNSAAPGNYLGGFIGLIFNANTFERCYATGLVTSTSSEIGGFIAFANETATPTITSCYYDKDATGFPDDTDTGKGTPLSTADMKLQSSYDGWDFDLLWTIQEGFNDGYPTLQNMPF